MEGQFLWEKFVGGLSYMGGTNDHIISRGREFQKNAFSSDLSTANQEHFLNHGGIFT